MYKIICTVLLLCTIGNLHSLPAPVNSYQYEPGVSYKYNYQFTILLNEDSNITSRGSSVGRNVGYRVTTDFFLTNVWQNKEDVKEKLLKLELMKPTLHVSSTLHSTDGITKHWSKLDNLSYPPMYIHWNNGLVKKVFILPDLQSIINIKKGLASIFQLHITQTEVKELDVSGLCSIIYKADGRTVKKSKHDCKNARYRNYPKNKLLSSDVYTFSEMVYGLLPDGIIQTATGREEVMMKLNMWKEAAVYVKSKFKLSLIEQYPDQLTYNIDDFQNVLVTISKEAGTKLQEENLEAVLDQEVCFDNCKSLGELVKEYGKHLSNENIAKIKSATGFLKLLDGFRRASKKELLILFKNANEKILPQLIDILAASQTKNSLDVAFELIDFESTDIALAERFLLCLSTSPYPSSTVLLKTLKLAHKKFKSEKLRATVLITLASLMKTYCSNNPKYINSKIIEDVMDTILQCDDPSCHDIHLQAMRNAAEPRFVSVLLKYIALGGNQGLLALEALKKIDVQYFTNEVTDALYKVYNEFWPNHDSAARVLAVELLLKSSPTTETIAYLLLSLRNREHPEVNTLVLAKIYDAAVKHYHIRSSLKAVLANSSVANYDTLAQNGTSTSYTKLLQATYDTNVTYGINLEMRPTGMLKRTSLDLTVTNENEEVPLLSLGLFVNGFGVTEEEQKAKEVPEEHSAGMELSVLGVKLRPYIFFTGTGELMGLVWSGTGSEMTPALQANLLLMDEARTVILQNGMPIDFILRGAVSTDVSGSIEISMWSKNAHAMVKNSASLLVQGFCRINASFVESHVDFALGGHSVMDMLVDLDYSHKPMKMCMQVEQPDFSFRHNVRKTETIPGSKHLIRTLKRRSLNFPGKSFSLHRKNYESCRELLQPKEQSSYW